MLYFMLWKWLPIAELAIRIVCGVVATAAGIKLWKSLAAGNEWEPVEDEGKEWR